MSAAMDTTEKHDAAFDTQDKFLSKDVPDVSKTEHSSAHSDEEILEPHAQAGVKRVEAIANVWNTTGLVSAYIIIWFIYLITSMQEVVVGAFNPYVTSAFALHSLTAATDIVASIVGGLVKIPLAKILDTWGRPQGLTLMLFVWVIGFIMMAGCNNVQTYAAAQVFFTVGSQGVSYCLTVFIADTSSLKNRALMLSFATSPYIVTAFVGPPISQRFLDGPGWRWGYGMFTILVPVVVSPLSALFFWYDHKAKKVGLVERSPTKINLQTIKRYIIEIDLFGILLLATGMALFLLSFSLYSYQPDQWTSPLILCFVIFGGLLVIAFGLWERFGAPVTFIPFQLLLDKTVFFAGLMFFFEFFNSAVWGSYFYSMLQVVFGLDVTQAGYVSAIYRVGSCFFSLIVGVLIRVTGRFKWLALYFAVPLMMLGVGLMIHFRQPGVNIGYIIMTQIFVAFSGGTIVICGEMAMMAPSDHQHIAVILAILNLFCSIGNAVGSTVSAAIWTGTFPKYLARYLPADADIATIYGDIVTQLSYPMGTPERDGINRAYSDSQRIMLITSVCLLAGALACVAVWRDIKVKDFKQVRGRVV